MYQPDSTTLAHSSNYDTTVSVPLFLSAEADTAHLHEEWTPLSLDSVFAAYVPPTPTVRQSLFTNHTLQPTHTEIQDLSHKPSSDWAFGILVLIIGLVTLYVNTFRFKVKDLLYATVSSRGLAFLYRNYNITRPSNIMPMSLIYAGSLSMLIMLVADYLLDIEAWNHSAWGFALCFTALTLFIFIKRGTIYALGAVLEDTPSVMTYNASSCLYQLTAGCTLIPLLLIAYFNPAIQHSLIMAMCVIIASLFGVRIIRGLSIITRQAKTARVYLFYYLCTVEIVPLLVAWKLINNM